MVSFSMCKVLGKNRSISHAVTETLLFGFVVASCVFMLVISFDSNDLKFPFVAFFLAVFIAMFAVDAIRNGYREFPLTVTHVHLISNYEFGRRRVFDIKKITWFKIANSRLIFIHNGWPSAIHVRGITKDQELELKGLLQKYA